MIIDSHVHWGKSIWGDFTPEYLLEILGDKIDFAICSNLEGIDSPVFKDEKTCNLEMLEVSKKYPKLRPLLVCQPDRSENADTIRYFLENYPEFIGLKIQDNHPTHSAKNALTTLPEHKVTTLQVFSRSNMDARLFLFSLPAMLKEVSFCKNLS